MSASLIRRRCSQSVPRLAFEAFEVLPVVSSFMWFCSPCGNNVSCVVILIGIDHRDFQAIDEANGLHTDFAIVEMIIDPFYRRPLENAYRIFKGDTVTANIA